jgi:hypothetical protein
MDNTQEVLKLIGATVNTALFTENTGNQGVIRVKKDHKNGTSPAADVTSLA